MIDMKKIAAAAEAAIPAPSAGRVVVFVDEAGRLKKKTEEGKTSSVIGATASVVTVAAPSSVTTTQAAHGLDASKIVGFTAMFVKAGHSRHPPNAGQAAYRYQAYVSDSHCIVTIAFGDGASLSGGVVWFTLWVMA